MRLVREYEAHDSLIVAFDFDNTIFDYHGSGGDYSEVIDLLHRASMLGFTMLLFTVDTDVEKVEKKLKYCEDELKIRVDYVNASPLFPTSIKPYYNILLDDRAGLESAYESLKYVVEYAENKLSTSREV